MSGSFDAEGGRSPRVIDPVAAAMAFEHLYAGAQRDLREALALLAQSEQRNSDLAERLHRIEQRRAVRWADKTSATIRAMRRRLSGSR